MDSSPRLRNRNRAHGQRGAYAVEFALVFLISFSLLYGVIAYGMLFAFRLGLQNAAEEGARAALRYQPTLDQRRERPQRSAATGCQASWLQPQTRQYAK